MSEVKTLRDLLEEVLEEEKTEKIEVAKKKIKVINKKIERTKKILAELEAEEEKILDTPIEDIETSDYEY